MSHHRGYDVIVIGGGHAGCEAALAAARLGATTLLLTINIDHIAQMSCNPAIGGIAKGQVVREIDALGGEMGRNTDASSIQFRMLNRAKGAAVLSPRAQCDKMLYQKRMQLVVQRQPNLFVHMAQVVNLHTCGERVTAVETEFGDCWQAATVVIATGTFLNGRMHYGMRDMCGGRSGDPAAQALASCLKQTLRLDIGRLKTGTPTRVLAGSIDFGSMTRQDADEQRFSFSFNDAPDEFALLGNSNLPQLPCYITASTPATAEIIRANLDQSPMYQGRIDGIGARYCPSFEDKVVRFPHHQTHTIYLEPEGVYTDEYYLNGISTSLPPAVQWQMLQSIPGFEKVRISRYAYAIEYDFVFPYQLCRSLALRAWPNVFLAGQINGTSGYEEAAAQGLLAGINAARFAAGNAAPIVLGRDQAYIGVMIDDLVTKDIGEPYRLFTSRAEHRLQLRQDNADLRLSRIGHAVGLLSAERLATLQQLEDEIAAAVSELQQRRQHGASFWELLKRPPHSYSELPGVSAISARAAEQVQILAHYEGYMQREQAQAQSMRRLELWPVPAEFAYESVPGLRNEAKLKLSRQRPETLAQAARIDGVTPAEIALLQIHLRRQSAEVSG